MIIHNVYFSCFYIEKRGERSKDLYRGNSRSLDSDLVSVYNFLRYYSSVAQWQSNRLLTDGLEVRVPPEELFREKLPVKSLDLGFF